VADGRPGQVPHFRDLLSWHTSEVTAGCLGEGCSSHSWPLRPKPAVAQIGHAAVSEVSARQPVTNQVTAHPGLVAARVFMAVGGIASTCAQGASFGWRLPLVLRSGRPQRRTGPVTAAT
jgi:hypothetical protein